LPFPVFLTEYPSTQINLATTDASKAGIYSFRLTVTDSLTGLSNNQVTFQTTLYAVTSLSLDTSTSIPSQIYKVNNVATVLAVPRYTWTPSQATTKFFYTLVAPTPSFVSLIGSGDQSSSVSIFTSDYSKTGDYTVTVQTFE
jgi:hypothetical protein